MSKPDLKVGDRVTYRIGRGYGRALITAINIKPGTDKVILTLRTDSGAEVTRGPKFVTRREE